VGQYQVIDWLKYNGAAEDLTAEDNEGHTPQYWLDRAEAGN